MGITERLPGLAATATVVEFANRQEPLYISVNGGGERRQLRGYLLGLGMEEKAISTFLNPDGSWGLHPDFLGYFEGQGVDMIDRITHDFEYVYEAIDLILSDSKETGFASHGRKHAERTVGYGLELLKYIDFPSVGSPDEQEMLLKRVIFTGLTHDLKMIYGRAANSMECEDFFKLVFGSSVVFNPNFQKIAHAINMHSEEVAINNVDLINESPETLLLIFGDKSDVNLARVVDTNWVKARDISEDKHAKLHALTHHPLDIFGSNEGRRINLEMHFSRFDSAHHLPDSFRKSPESEKIKVPPEMHASNRDYGIWYVYSYMGETERTFGMRMALQAIALFGLSKGLETVSFNFVDYFIEHGGYYWVNRESYQTQFAFLYFNFHKDEIREGLIAGRLPTFPKILGDHVLERLVARYKVNLPLNEKELAEIGIDKGLVEELREGLDLHDL